MKVTDRFAARRARRLKQRLIEIAVERHGVRSLADCGGVWNVDGAYTFHALSQGVERAVLVDTTIPDELIERAGETEGLELVEGNFGLTETVERVGEVDAVCFYDVLLHQVDPDWDEVLARWARVARCILVVNQQWVGGTDTVRLPDLGRDEYLATVPDSRWHAEVIDHLDEISPEHGRPFRDVHEIWQWGITDRDLLGVASGLDLSVSYQRDAGAYPGAPRFRNRGFVLTR